MVIDTRYNFHRLPSLPGLFVCQFLLFKTFRLFPALRVDPWCDPGNGCLRRRLVGHEIEPDVADCQFVVWNLTGELLCKIEGKAVFYIVEVSVMICSGLWAGDAIREEPFEDIVRPNFADVAEVNRLVDAARLEKCTINAVKCAGLPLPLD